MSSKVQSIPVFWFSALAYVIICDLWLISLLLFVRLDVGPVCGLEHEQQVFGHGLGSQVLDNITATITTITTTTTTTNNNNNQHFINSLPSPHAPSITLSLFTLGSKPIFHNSFQPQAPGILWTAFLDSALLLLSKFFILVLCLFLATCGRLSFLSAFECTLK